MASRGPLLRITALQHRKVRCEPGAAELFVSLFRWELEPSRLSEDSLGVFLWIVLIGLIAGVIARLLMPGPNNPPGFVLTAALGIVGAFLSTWIGQTVGWYRPDQGAGLVGATVGAIVVLLIWRLLAVQRVVSDPGVSRTNWPPPGS
jgi:uncharacterized membrane protein YeaQ/YmgE (transglycosylase-associated protein family)